ncbi:MAG: hypothetical protein WBA93_35630 [Microcoleaceae cyanobacterium]
MGKKLSSDREISKKKYSKLYQTQVEMSSQKSKRLATLQQSTSELQQLPT